MQRAARLSYLPSERLVTERAFRILHGSSSQAHAERGAFTSCSTFAESACFGMKVVPLLAELGGVLADEPIALD